MGRKGEKPKGLGISLTEFFLTSLLLLVFVVGCGRTEGAIKIVAASDLQPAFEEFGKIFKQQTGIKPIFIFGSSGQLAEQVLKGAEVDLFASANEGYVDKVISQGRGSEDTRRLYALGRLAVVSGNDDMKPPSVEGLGNASINKIAIANPEHAPYGRAAREALKNTGDWDKVRPKLVLGENARQTFQYAETGNVDAAIVPLSLALSSKRPYGLVPKELHSPISQTLVVIRGSREKEASRFVSLLISPEGDQIMKKYGFDRPDAEK